MYTVVKVLDSATFEVFTAMNIQVVVFWVVTPCSDVIGYQRFGGPCCLHRQGEVVNGYRKAKGKVVAVLN
jgi:hypothetical protein